MFLRFKIRRKDGKEHRAWSVVETRRVHGGRVVQRQVLYLGEINDSQKAAWSKAIEVFDEGAGQPKQIALFPEDRVAPALDCDVVSIRLSKSIPILCALAPQKCLEDCRRQEVEMCRERNLVSRHKEIQEAGRVVISV